MSANQIKVRRKEIPPTNWKKINVFIFLVVLIFLGAAVTVAVTAFPDRFNFSSAPLEVIADGNRQIIRVPAGGDIQAAVNRAKSGDIIELKAGTTYYGEIILPNKALTDFITIQTSAVNELPENRRVKPSQANLMAKIVSRGKGKPALSTEKGAHHYRLIGIEFTPSNPDYIYNLIYFGEPEKVSETAHHLEIDRCYIHSHTSGRTRRGVALNSSNTVIKNSYVEGFAYEQEESQGICGWTGTKDVLLLNNYIEGGAENVMFGGSDPVSPDLIPADIEVRGNYFFKPAEWKGRTMKNLFELKNAKRVRLVGNYMENSWNGAALTITVRNDGGKAEFSTIEDILIKDNFIVNAAEGINILGTDDIYPSQTLKNLTIVNNVFLDIGNRSYTGSGYFIQISGGKNILIANNTVFNKGNLTVLYGDLPENFLFRDNIVGHGEYGIHGHPAIKSAAGQKLFQNNVIVNNRGINEYDSSYPPGNFWVPSYRNVGFLDLANNDFRLAPGSRFKGKGREKPDIGSSLDVNSVK